MSKNLHCKTALTEFDRNFENQNDTILSKIVNTFGIVYNNLNSVPSTTRQTPPTNSPARTPLQDVKEEPGEEETSSKKAENISYSPSASSLTSTEQQRETSSESNQSKSEEPQPGPSGLQRQTQEFPDVTQGRTPINVLRRIKVLIGGKNNDLGDYKNTDLQKFWIHDSKSKECYECCAKFSTFRRKHHCRLCGCIFCSKCCNQFVPGKIVHCSGDLKVCSYCFKTVLSYLKSSDINSDLRSDLQALEEDLSSKSIGSSSERDSGASSPVMRKISVGYQEERLVSNTNILSNVDRRNILQQSNSLKQLHEEMLNSLPIRNKGREFISFLIANQKSSNKIQAQAILSAMVEAGFIVHLKFVEASSPSLSHDFSPHPQPNVTEFLDNEIYELQKFEEHTQRSSLEKRVSVISNIQETSTKEQKEQELHNSLISISGTKALMEAYSGHEELLVSQLLRYNNLEQSWSKVLIPLCATISHSIQPSTFRPDSMDIRNFVNMKKVPGGSRNECSIIAGTVFTKNVAHKKMATRIENPRILLLQCAIAYHRVEGKFVSIETLLLQEKEYLRNVTLRILSMKPDVILVHKNVSGIAQDMLRDNGVSLILDVKLSVLDRLARCLECDIVTLIDSNIGKPKLGTCDLFYTKNFEIATGVNKTLMFFENNFNHRGCTLLLRGGPEIELAKVKKVASFLLFARYNFRLEASFLMDEFAQPPSPKPSIFDSKEHSPMDGHKMKNSGLLKSEDKSGNSSVKKEKTIQVENVADFSDPLRATHLSPSEFDPTNDIEFAVQNLYDNKFKTCLNSTVLSISPFMSFPLPYLETEIGRKCFLRKYFPKDMYFSKQWSDNGTDKVMPIEHHIPVPESVSLKPPHDFITMKITEVANTPDFQTALANFRRIGGRYPYGISVLKPKKQQIEIQPQRSIEETIYKDAFDVANHQRLPVLFCSYYYNTKELPASFCTPPILLNMHFYGQDDIMLGLFLEHYCFRSSYICSSCKLPMMDHVRRYAHSLGCIQVKLYEDSNKTDDNSILITSRCTICNQQTPSVPMSKDTWCLSFAKFLELKFHGHSYKRRHMADGSPEHQLDRKPCNHSLHKDYIQYFSSNGVAVSFMYNSVEIWEIKLPQVYIQLKPPQVIDNKLYVEKIKNLSQKGYEIYAKIHEKMANMATEVESPIQVNLKKALGSDQLNFKYRVGAVQTLLTEKIVYSDEIGDAIMAARKELADSIELWGPRLNEAVLQSKHPIKLESSTSIESAQICTEDLAAGDDLAKEMPLNLEASDSEILEETIECGNSQHVARRVDKTTIKKILYTLLPSSSNDVNMLPSPFSPNEHYGLQTGLVSVLVNDQDLSSVIAYSLASHEYHKQLKDLINCTNHNNPSASNKSPTVNSESGSPVSKRKSPGEGSQENEDSQNSKSTTDKGKKTAPSPHIEVQFQDSTMNFTCKMFFAKEFDELRTSHMQMPKFTAAAEQEAGPSHADIQPKLQKEKPVESDEVRKNFIRSLSASSSWEARGGKSGSTFSKTSDDRFILKEMTKFDVMEFEKFAPNYFEYVNLCLNKNLPTLLAKIFGVYRVFIKKKDSEKVEKSFLVIENLFCDRKITNKYDLKGSERNRLVDPTSQTEETVLLDENLIKTSWSKPIYILTHSRTILREAINRDSTFLEKNSVMDYSLLVGLDSETNFLIVGIIDYNRKYTLDKQLESFVKTALDKSKLPTIVSPSIYKVRFSEAMERYFLAVPDRFEGLTKH